MSGKGEDRTGGLMRLLRISAVALVTILVAGLAGAYAVATLDLYSSVRQDQAAQVLTRIFDRPVEVRGQVVLTPGRRLGVKIEDTYIERSSGSARGEGRVFDTVEFDAPYGLFRGDVSGIRNFRMSGADIEYRADPSGERRQTWSFELLSILLNNPVFDNLELTDVEFHFIDEADGWNEVFRIETFKLETTETSPSTEVSIEAAVNGTPLSVSGVVPSSVWVRDNNSRGPFDLTLAFPGLESRLSGTVDTSAKVARIDGDLSAKSGSVTKLLASLGLESAVEGKATLAWQSSGPIDGFDIAGLTFEFDGDDGDVIHVEGSVSDVFQGSVFDLDFTSTLAQPEAASSSSLSINLKEISGRVSGPVEALSIDRTIVTTNAVLLEFDEIGPISVGRIIKGDGNRIGLSDITILDGPEGAPYLVMKGDVEDILALKGVTLSGTFELPTAILLNRPATDAPGLGTVKGTVVVGETSGALGLEELRGKTAGTDLLNLGFALAIREFRVLNELEFSTELTLPKPEAALAELGIQTDRTFPEIRFSGSSGLSSDGANFTGDLVSGATQVNADLQIGPAETDGKWMLTGAISSKEMDFTDLAALSDFAQLSVAGEENGPDIELTKEFEAALSARVELDVKKIVSGKKHAGNLTGTLEYDADHLKLAGLKLDYIGGTVSGDFGVDLGQESHPAHAHGRMEKFPLRSLMHEIGLTAPISSTVYASFDVTGNARSEVGFLKTLSGNVSASLWGGTLPNRLLDLTGLNVFTWLVTSNKDHTSKLVCAVLPLHFRNGVATSKRLIVETENVQLVGAGTVNLRSGALDLSFAPRAKRKQLVEIVSPFEIHGTLGKPDVTVKDAGPGRAIGEVVSLPLNLVSHIFRGSGPIDEKARPCTLPKNTGPK
ncbi:AsmA-like C-terminal region-containing protein [Roseibium sp.]|uniref:AsmA family protein n=1 Tax=Roseibium sp. TaxID=1936156 RepID=UPI003BAA57C3